MTEQLNWTNAFEAARVASACRAVRTDIQRDNRCRDADLADAEGFMAGDGARLTRSRPNLIDAEDGPPVTAADLLAALDAEADPE